MVFIFVFDPQYGVGNQELQPFLRSSELTHAPTASGLSQSLLATAVSFLFFTASLLLRAVHDAAFLLGNTRGTAQTTRTKATSTTVATIRPLAGTCGGVPRLK